MELDNSAGSSTMYANFFTAPLADPPATGTLLLEVRGFEATGDAAIEMANYGASYPQLYRNGAPPARAGGEYRVALGANDRGTPIKCSTRNHATLRAGAKLTAEVRVSLYEGEYDGPYIPYE